jgi:hypothetical protein
MFIFNSTVASIPDYPLLPNEVTEGQALVMPAESFSLFCSFMDIRM